MLAELETSPIESPQNSNEVPLVVVQAPIKPGKRLFTTENAREMSRLGAIARAKKRAERIARAQASEPIPNPSEDYVKLRLACVRAQIGKLDKQILQTRDPQALNWLASAQAKLAEQERILAGRPLPGNLRPKASRVPNAGNSSPPAPLD